ncbi:MAG: nickel-responsive transcriptional regulator NikR [Planctomycetota bacterium]|jgi:CopG family nickel-responsive transcriptional regulator
MGDLTRTALAIDRKLLERFDAWTASHGYSNRSEAVRDIIRNTLIEAEWADPNAPVIAVLSIVFDHSKRRLAQEMTELQHEHHRAVLCSQHVHLDGRRCMEVVIMQGKARALRRLSDAIIATRGVIAGKVTLMSRNL